MCCRIVVLFMALTLVGGFSHAQGSSGPMVLLARGASPGGMEVRVQAELEAVGFQVVVVDLPVSGNPGQSLREIARKAGAGAAILCEVNAGFVDIWVADRMTGKIVQRQVRIPPDSVDADSEVALGTVELLRASLLEVRTEHGNHGEVAPSTPAMQLAAPTAEEASVYGYASMAPADKAESSPGFATRRATFAAGLSLLVMSADTAPFLDMELDLGLRLFHGLGLYVNGQIPLTSATVEEPQGSARLRAGIAGGGVRYGLSWPSRRISAVVQLGWTAVFVLVSGTPSEDAVGHEDTVVTSAPMIGTGVGVAASQRVRIRLDLQFGLMLSEVIVRIDQRDLAQLGSPLFATGLGVEFY